MHPDEFETMSADDEREESNSLIRLTRDYEEEEAELEERESQCKAIEYTNTVVGAIADVSNDIGSIPAVGEAFGIITGPVAAVSHVVSAGLDIASIAMNCDDVPFEQLKLFMKQKFNEIDRKLDKNTAAMEEVSKLVSETFNTVEKTRAEMNENFKLVLDTIESQEIKSIVFKINDFKNFFDKEQQRIKGLPKDKYVAKLLEQQGILTSLKEVREPTGNSLGSALNQLLDKNSNYAIPKVVDDNKAFQALYALFYGTQTYASVMFFLLEQHTYLANYYYQKGEDVSFNREFDLVSTIFEDFKSSLTAGNDGLIDNVIEVLETVKNKKFMKNADSKLYHEIVSRTNDLKKLKNEIELKELPIIDDLPHVPVQISFPDEDEVPTPIGDWFQGVKVRYAVQLESKGRYSKLSEWTDPFTAEDKACPVIKVPVDEQRRNRLIFRKFDSDKIQFAGVMSQTQTNFRDIDRDLFNAALNVNKNTALNDVTTLIEKGANIAAKFDNNRSAMHAVALRGNGKVALRFLLDKEGTDVEQKDKNGYTPLHIAADAGQSGFVKLLLNHGANVNAKSTKENLSALHISCRNGFSKTVKTLLESPNVDVNQKESEGYTPLHTAVMGGYQVVDALLQHKNININAQSNAGSTPLHLAVIYENQEVADSLIQGNADLNIQDSNHMAPIHVAAAVGSVKMLNYFFTMKQKVSINSVNKSNNWTPLHYAIFFEHEDAALEILKQDDVDLTVAAVGNITPLHLAVSKGQLNIVKKLLEKGSNIEEKTSEGYTPLHLGAMRKEQDIANLLIEKGANIEARSADNLTPLHSAAQSGRKATVLNLLEKGADIEAKTEDGSTALHLAATGRKMNTVKALLEKGANLKASDNNKYMPIHKAIINEDKDMVRLFVDKDPSFINDNTEAGRISATLVMQKLMTALYFYFINNYDETENHEKVYERFFEQGKIDLALLFFNKDTGKEDFKLAFYFSYGAIKYCLEEKRKSSGSGDSSAHSLQSPDSGQCLSTLNEKLSSARRSIPEVFRNLDNMHNKRGINSATFNDVTHQLESMFPSPKRIYNKDNFDHVDGTINNMDVNGGLLLLDVLTRKFTERKYNTVEDKYISEMEARSAALDLTSRFEELLSEIKNIPAGEEINMAEVSSNVYKAIKSGGPVSKVLCSYVDALSDFDSQQIEKLVDAYMSAKPSVILPATEEYQNLPHLLISSCLEPQRMIRSLPMKQKHFLF